MPEISIDQAMDLAMQHHRAARIADAESIYRQVLAVQPRHPVALNLLGIITIQRGMHHAGIDLIRQAIAVEPAYAAAYNNLGHAVSDLGNMDEAIDCYRKAIELNPRMDEAYNNLGVALKDVGLLDEAIAMHRRAVEINPTNIISYDNLVYTLYFHEGYDAAAIYREHVEWNRRFAANYDRVVRGPMNDRSPERRLRIGYVSPNLRNHVVGRFMRPLLAAHDRANVEVYCYSLAMKRDDFSRSLEKNCDVWRDSGGFTQEQLAETIRRDRIDILIDLTMHMQNNRLLVFARRPAPVQVTYLAYAGTTGLNAIGYRLSDPYLDPPGSDEPIYSEKTVRLAETYWCYESSDKAGDVTELPMKKNAAVTFGCLNNFCKVSPGTLAAWGEIMRQLPGSKLLLHATPGKHRARVLETLAKFGVTSDRVEFIPHIEIGAYFGQYQKMDIALDPFPYAGGTTTCDALWMGVPVITLAGRTAVGRGGVSILNNIGLPELIAQNAEQYVRIAVELAQNPTRLETYRHSLRERMKNSVVMDAKRFARNIETAYRGMWRAWCSA